MKRTLHAVAPLLSIILSLQVMLAPLHCLAMARGASGFETIICSPDGLRVVHVDGDGQDQPSADGAACFFCADTARGLPNDPPTVALPGDPPTGLDWHLAAADTLPPPGRAPPYAPRGPPLRS